MKERMQIEEFRISEKEWEAFKAICKKVGLKPRTYIRKMVKRETSRLKENLGKFKEK